MPQSPKAALASLEQMLIHRRVRGPGIIVARSARLVGMPIIRAFPGSTIDIGERSELVSTPSRATMVLNHACMVQTYRAGARIALAGDVGMSGATICSVLGITIGARTMLGANVTVIDTNFHPLAAEGRRFAPIPEPRPEDEVVIGADVFIGTGAFILPGTRIGDGTVVAAASVVKGEVPAGVIVAGNPARVVKTLV
jgi:carbonic anhydrase/acetyltransferase-like protein (isoleucine patch superfamily)